jgi:pSer/pThr/pTyr-binding forkhead associated (FHA) protein
MSEKLRVRIPEFFGIIIATPSGRLCRIRPTDFRFPKRLEEAAMAAKIKLTISGGSQQKKELIFQEPIRPVVGRADDCDIRFPQDPEHMDVSRHHCLFEIDPPTVKVRDLGSRNGTFVNGEKIHQPPRNPLAPDSGWNAIPPQELKEGDEVKVGHNIIRIDRVE